MSTPISPSSHLPPIQSAPEQPKEQTTKQDELYHRIAMAWQSIPLEKYLEIGKSRRPDIPKAIQTHESKQQKIEISEQELDKLIQDLKKAAPEMSACIAELDELKPSAKALEPNVQSRVDAILRKYVLNGSFDPQTPLTWAASTQNPFLVSWLLEHGESADTADSTQTLPLGVAAYSVNLDIMELLVKHGGLPEGHLIRPNIYILIQPNSPPNYFEMVQYALKDLESTNIGKRLLENIAKGPHLVFITNNGELVNDCIDSSPVCPPSTKGRSSIIHYSGRASTYFTIDAMFASQPNFVALFHELTHAYHSSKGTNVDFGTECDKLGWFGDEEYKTIMGFPSKHPERKTPKITENALLAELKLKERIGYYDDIVLKQHSVAIFKRIQAIANLYREYYKECHYEGQAHNPPPPLLHFKPEYFGDSQKIIHIYNFFSEKTRSSILIEPATKQLPQPIDFQWKNFTEDQWPTDFERKKDDPIFADATIRGLGAYRLSEAEAGTESTKMG
jgi:hypothetical protein